jgi:hypothetical protein
VVNKNCGALTRLGLFLRCKRLIAVRHYSWALDDDEGVIEGVMAAVAACRQLVERARE